MIKAVIFDLGKVLVDFDMNRVWSGLAKYTNIPTSEMESLVYETSDKDVLKYGTSKKQDMVAKYNTGEINDQVFFEWMQEKLKLKGIGFNEFAKAWGDIFTINQPICDLVDRLSRNGYKLVALSDTNPIQMRQIMAIVPDMHVWFGDRIVTSYDPNVMSMKPNEKNYLEARSRARAESKECAYVDDRQKYVDAVVKFGMHGLFYDWDNEAKRDELLVDNLRKLGVRC